MADHVAPPDRVPDTPVEHERMARRASTSARVGASEQDALVVVKGRRKLRRWSRELQLSRACSGRFALIECRRLRGRPGDETPLQVLSTLATFVPSAPSSST